MSNATAAKNMIEQDDRAMRGFLDHCGFCMAQNDRAETSTKPVTYEKLDHWQNLIEQSDREKTHFFDHNTVPLEGRGLIEQGAGPNTPPIRRLEAENIPRPVAIPMRLVWFTPSVAAPAPVSASSGPGCQRISASPSPQSVRRHSLSPPGVRASNVMLPPAQFPSAGVQQPRCRLSWSRRRGPSFPSAQKFQQEPMGGSFPHFVLSITGPDRRASPIAA